MSNDTKPITVEQHCQDAKRLIQEAQIRIRDAAYQAQTEKNYEVDKTLTAVDSTLGGIVGLLISVPRLKG